jgi:hypothetical protein
MNNRDAWFLAGLVLVTILALYAPKLGGLMVLLIAVFIGIGPLYDKGFFRRT